MFPKKLSKTFILENFIFIFESFRVVFDFFVPLIELTRVISLNFILKFIESRSTTLPSRGYPEGVVADGDGRGWGVQK